MAALLELRSASSDHIWVPGGFGARTGLGTLLELWLDSTGGLVGLLGVPEGSPAAEPLGVEYCSSRRLVVRKLVLRVTESSSKTHISRYQCHLVTSLLGVH